MEKAFIISKESEYSKELDEYVDLSNQQKKFINKYFAEKEIEATAYRIGGNGGVNCVFKQYDSKNIFLYIKPTENDLKKYEKMLCKEGEYGLRQFKARSEICKDFAQRCIDEKVIINLYEPRLRDYFKSIEYRGCSAQRFVQNDTMYIKIDSDYLDGKDVPNGFTEIKLSDYHIKLEEHAKQHKEEK